MNRKALFHRLGSIQNHTIDNAEDLVNDRAGTAFIIPGDAGQIVRLRHKQHGTHLLFLRFKSDLSSVFDNDDGSFGFHRNTSLLGYKIDVIMSFSGRFPASDDILTWPKGEKLSESVQQLRKPSSETERSAKLSFPGTFPVAD